MITRYQGEKDQQHALHAGGQRQWQPPASLRMGAEVPIPHRSRRLAIGRAHRSCRRCQLPDIGTNIDCGATTRRRGAFELNISIDDTSVYANQDNATLDGVGNMPVIPFSFKSTQYAGAEGWAEREFTAATDRVSGEMIRIGVTLRVVK